MRGVRLDHHRAARCECRRGIATGDRESERKFDAPKTATGPIGTLRNLEVGTRQRLALGQRRSIRTPRKPPSRTTSANMRNCPVVRLRSPATRARGRPVSVMQRSPSSSPSASILSAIASRKAARCSKGNALYGSNAAAAAPQAVSRSASVARPNAGSIAAPFVASIAQNDAACADDRFASNEHFSTKRRHFSFPVAVAIDLVRRASSLILVILRATKECLANIIST